MRRLDGRDLPDREGISYWGDRGDWLVVISHHDSMEQVDRSNFRVLRRDLEARFPDDATVEEFGGDYGRIEHLIVRPGTAAHQAAQDWLDKLEDYCVADEQDLSELELEERDHVTIDEEGYELERKNGGHDPDNRWEPWTPGYLSWASNQREHRYCAICEGTEVAWAAEGAREGDYRYLCGGCVTTQEDIAAARRLPRDPTRPHLVQRYLPIPAHVLWGTAPMPGEVYYPREVIVA